MQTFRGNTIFVFWFLKLEKQLDAINQAAVLIHNDCLYLSQEILGLAFEVCTFFKQNNCSKHYKYNMYNLIHFWIFSCLFLFVHNRLKQTKKCTGMHACHTLISFWFFSIKVLVHEFRSLLLVMSIFILLSLTEDFELGCNSNFSSRSSVFGLHFYSKMSGNEFL